jgi:hypothetical protein
MNFIRGCGMVGGWWWRAGLEEIVSSVGRKDGLENVA